MILVACLMAVIAASSMVPGRVRAGWRRAWISEIWHYNTLLHDRGVKHRYVTARVWHHSRGALRDAWRLRSATPGTRQLLVAMHKPRFSLAMIVAFLAFLAVASGGFSITRAMLNAKFPDGERLMLISEARMPYNERHAVPYALLEYWQAHNTMFSGIAGYQWDTHGTAWVTPEFFQVVGTRPKRFLLHRITEWKPAASDQDLGVVGRLKPGVSEEAAQTELRDLAARYRHFQRPSPFQEAALMPLLVRTRQPLYSYDLMSGLTAVLLLIAAGLGIRADWRRSGHIRFGYWGYFCAKAILLPLAFTLLIWEFTRSTSFTVTGSATFVAEPFYAWLIILGCGAIVWWVLADQRVRCRACLQTLQYPVRIGSLGAVLFDHAGTELVCCGGHGSLYVPYVSSDYVQSGGWTPLDSADIDPETVRR